MIPLHSGHILQIQQRHFQPHKELCLTGECGYALSSSTSPKLGEFNIDEYDQFRQEIFPTAKILI